MVTGAMGAAVAMQLQVQGLTVVAADSRIDAQSEPLAEHRIAVVAADLLSEAFATPKHQT